MTGGAGAATRLAKNLLQIGARSFERGREAEDDSGEERHGKREKQDASIERNFAGTRERAGKDIDGGFGSEESKKKTKRTA